MRTIQLLKAARNLISRPENWIQGQLSDGKGRYCARGALMNVKESYEEGDFALVEAMYPDERERGVNELLRTDVTIRDSGYARGQIVAGFNNSSTHQEVLELFDRAIARQLVIDSMADVHPAAGNELPALTSAQLVGV